MSFNVTDIRNQFPILETMVGGKPLVYFDNAATTQKPKVVLDALDAYYASYNANIHRGIHQLAEKATAAFEATRTAVKEFLNANSTEEIIFTYGTTDSINLVARTFGEKYLNAGDEIIITSLEHHSNIVPWQMLCERKGCVLKVIPIDEHGDIILEAFDNLLTAKTKLVSVVHVSNALGTINPIEYIIPKAHAVGAKVLVDGAQASSHLAIDVVALDVDFYALSAHKLFGPTGTGILYGKKELLLEMPPYRGGGEMIKEVTFEKTTYADLPYKFEAGTPNIADVIAFKYALDYFQSLDKEALHAHEDDLLVYATAALKEIGGIRIIGEAKKKVSVVSFVLEGVHPQDIGILLDQQGIAVRTGHHCTQPLMQCFNIPGTVRASFAPYNTREEIDLLVEGLHKVKKFLL
jgi:cysteine desulfurase/selenocysteine lyase